jgi:electron-transferring-flavoprotein dehydrogenase
MKTGMLAGESAAMALMAGATSGEELCEFQSAVRNSWVYDELDMVRNCKPAFKAGLLPGIAYTGASLLVTGGREPWTFSWSKRDSETTKLGEECKPIDYPKADGIISFELLDNLSRTGVNHNHDQPAHLKVKPELTEAPLSVSLAKYAAPESRFCPARVYEFPETDGVARLQINAQNCIHCKCCSIKTPLEYISWTVPEGGGGPQYAAM